MRTSLAISVCSADISASFSCSALAIWSRLTSAELKELLKDHGGPDLAVIGALVPPLPPRVEHWVQAWQKELRSHRLILRFHGNVDSLAGTGDGVFISASGESYEGAFHNGEAVGPGTYTARNGDVYEATFDLGVPVGPVTIMRADGTREELVFEDGRPVE